MRSALSALVVIALSPLSWAAESPHRSLYERTVDLERGETERIQAHLEHVIVRLKSRPVAGLTPEQRTLRTRCIERLATYRQEGRFPRNRQFPGLTPIFIDRDQRACAVADLMLHTGAGSIARSIATLENRAYVPEISDARVVSWADRCGLTLEECAWIQPSYCFGGEPTDFECTSAGPHVLLTWTNQDDYDEFWLYRNSDYLGVLDGSLESTVDLSVAAGTYTYFLLPVCGGGFPSQSSECTVVHVPTATVPFVRGDCAGDGGTQLADGVGLLSYLFQNGDSPPCLEACDVNADGNLGIADPLYLFQYLFQSGPEPDAPFATCGEMASTMGCEMYFGCP